MTSPYQPQYPPQYAPAFQPSAPAFQQPYQPQFAPQSQFTPAAQAPVPVRASLEDFSDQPTGSGGGAVTKFFKGRPQGSWLQLRVTRDLNSSDITQQQNDGALQFFKTNGVPDPMKPKLVLVIKTEVLASSDPAGAQAAFPDGAAAVWLKGLTKDALVASIGAAGLPDPDTIFRKGKIGGAIITMISAGEKPPNNPMFSATKLYNFQYQPGGNEMSAFQSEQSVPQAAPPQSLQQIAQDGSGFPGAGAPVPPTQAPPATVPPAAAPPQPPAPPSAAPATPSYAQQAPPAPPQAPQGYASQPPAPPAPSPLDAERQATLARLRGGQQ